MKKWSEQTIEERLDTSISFWQKALAKVDHDGTALTHDTYDKDPVRYNMAETYSSFVQTLHMIKGGP